MSSKDIVISVKNLEKRFEIYDRPVDRFKQLILPSIQKLLGFYQKQYFKEFNALNNITFNVYKGETLGIVGCNGSGKSTLLQIICGIINPTNGSVRINGRVAALLELGAGFNTEFTGRENIYMNASVLGLTDQEIDTRFDEILEFSGIGDFIDQPVKTYSSGMFVRLAFSIAINVDPEILIIDEALAVGDPGFQVKCMKKIEDFRNNGVTVVMVTHDLGAILQFSDKCLVLDNGLSLGILRPKEAIDKFKKLLVKIPSDPEKQNHHINSRVANLLNGEFAQRLKLNKEGCEIYGNSKGHFLDFGIFDSTDNFTGQKLFVGDIYKFKMLFKFQDVVDDPIFTLTIRDLTGRDIVGTNSKNESINIGIFKPGEIVEVTFTHLMRLAPGSYLVTFACSGFELGEFTVYERLYHIVIIDIIAKKEIVGLYDMEAKVEVIKK